MYSRPNWLLPGTTFLLLLLSGGSVASREAQTFSQWGVLQPGPYRVGFRSVVVLDTSRYYEADVYDPALNPSRLRSRPVQISIWYPAEVSDVAVRMPYGEYLLLSDKEKSLSDWTAEETHKLLEGYAERFAGNGTGRQAAVAHLERLTAAFKDAQPAGGRFPLLVYSPSMLGRVVGNTVMCEYLASHGYVVAGHPSMGVTPDLMTTEPNDLELQARDLEFVVGYMQGQPNVDDARVGAVGHSWGGMAALLSATRTGKIRAVVSLDGSEEMWRDVLEASPDYDPAKLQVPYMRITKPTAPGQMDAGLFDSIQHTRKYRVLFDSSVGHFDFVSSNSLRHLLRGSAQLEEKQRVLALVSKYVLSFFDSILRDDRVASAFLTDLDAARAVSDKVLHVETSGGAEVILSDGAFIRMILRDGVEKALEYHNKVVAKDPASFSEERLLRLGEMLMWTGRYNDQAFALFRLAAERFPRSARAWEMIGNVYYWNLGDSENARKNYEKSFQLDPSNLRVKDYLEQIESASANP